MHAQRSSSSNGGAAKRWGVQRSLDGEKQKEEERIEKGKKKRES